MMAQRSRRGAELDPVGGCGRWLRRVIVELARA